MNLRDMLVKGGAVPTETFTVMVDGEACVLEARGLSVGEIGELQKVSVIKSVDDDGESVSTVDEVKSGVEMVMRCLYDPTTGTRVFADTDEDVVRGLSMKMFNELLDHAGRVCGIVKDSVAVAEKNSEATPA